MTWLTRSWTVPAASPPRRRASHRAGIPSSQRATAFRRGPVTLWRMRDQVSFWEKARRRSREAARPVSHTIPRLLNMSVAVTRGSSSPTYMPQ